MLILLGLIMIGLFAFFVMRTASDNGYSALLWTPLCVVIGIVCQFGLPICVGIVIAIVFLIRGIPISKMNEAISFTTDLTISIIALGLSVVGMWLVLRHVAKIPDEVYPDEIPPPPTFDQQ